MRCSSCGVVGPDDSRICPSCGLAAGTPSPDAAEPGPDRSGRRALVTVVIVVALGAVGGSAAFASFRSGRPERAQSVSLTRNSQERSSTTTSHQRSTTSTTEPLPPVEFTDDELAEAFGDAVFRVEAEGCGVPVSGSAFAIDQYHVVTSWHVVSGDNNPRLVAHDGTARGGRVIGALVDPDIAVIRVNDDRYPIGTALEWADTDELEAGQPLVGLGYPEPEHDFKVSTGTILGFQTGHLGRKAIRTDASFDRGSSGGPVLTTRGQVAGVVTAMEPNDDGVQKVALLFTAAAVRQPIDAMVDSPAIVVVDCDVVPDFPEDRLGGPLTVEDLANLLGEH
jgi:S1-C subfamily serine protease